MSTLLPDTENTDVRTATSVSRSSSSKPDMTGMLISDKTRSGRNLRIAAKPSRPS
jgi:hypothetical protein